MASVVSTRIPPAQTSPGGPCLSVQVLRSRFCPADDQDGPRQTIMPTKAVSLSVGEVPTNGKPLLQRGSDGAWTVTEDTSLHTAWRAFAAAPFDLYSSALIRLQASPFMVVTFGTIAAMLW